MQKNQYYQGGPNTLAQTQQSPSFNGIQTQQLNPRLTKSPLKIDQTINSNYQSYSIAKTQQIQKPYSLSTQMLSEEEVDSNKFQYQMQKNPQKNVGVLKNSKQNVQVTTSILLKKKSEFEKIKSDEDLQQVVAKNKKIHLAKGSPVLNLDFYNTSQQQFKLQSHSQNEYQKDLNSKSQNALLNVHFPQNSFQKQLSKENISLGRKIINEQSDKEDMYQLQVKGMFEKRFQNQKQGNFKSVSKQTSEYLIKTPQQKSGSKASEFPDLLQNYYSSEVLKSEGIKMNRNQIRGNQKFISQRNQIFNSVDRKSTLRADMLQLNNHELTLNQYGMKSQTQKKQFLSHERSQSIAFTGNTVSNQIVRNSINLSPMLKKEDLIPSVAQNPLLDLSWITQKGQSSSQQKVNQDRFILKKNLSDQENVYLLAVADGHGSNGHLVSKQIKKIITQIFEFEDKRMCKVQFKNRNISSIFQLLKKEQAQNDGITLFQTYIKVLLAKLFHSINKQIETQKQYDVQLSGSTLIVALVSQDFVVTANCGDSRCILINQNQTQENITFQTEDHKPNLPIEQNRIENQFKGKVGQLPHRLLQQYDEEPQLLEGCAYRVWSPYLDMPGLAMSRSIGDSMAKNLGVIAEPDINIIPTKSQDNSQVIAIFLASDGIWDVFESQEIAQMLKINSKSLNTKEFVSRILNEANRRWLRMPQNTGNGKHMYDIDDITMIFGLFPLDQ
eukprot:403361284